MSVRNVLASGTKGVGRGGGGAMMRPWRCRLDGVEMEGVMLLQVVDVRILKS